MKIKDYAAVSSEIKAQLGQRQWGILDFVDEDTATLIVFNIYMTNDVLKGFGQDVPEYISVISSRKRISVISGKHSSFFQADEDLCTYDDMEADIEMILITLDAAVSRLEYNVEWA